MPRRSKYPEQFRRNAAQLVLDGNRPIRDVVRELGVNHGTMRNWDNAQRRERRDGPAAPGGEERAELARLRRSVRTPHRPERAPSQVGRAPHRRLGASDAVALAAGWVAE